MPNQDAPFGFSVVSRTGAAYMGVGNRYHIPATNAEILAFGDAVKMLPGSDLDGVGDIVKAIGDGTDTMRGIIIGFLPLTRAQEDLPNITPALTESYAIVADDDDLFVLIQADGPLDPLFIGLNAEFNVSDPDPFTGRSLSTLKADTPALTATFPLKIIEIYLTPDNRLLDNAGDPEDFPVVLCKLNTHEWKGVGTPIALLRELATEAAENLKNAEAAEAAEAEEKPAKPKADKGSK